MNENANVTYKRENEKVTAERTTQAGEGGRCRQRQKKRRNANAGKENRDGTTNAYRCGKGERQKNAKVRGITNAVKQERSECARYARKTQNQPQTRGGVCAQVARQTHAGSNRAGRKRQVGRGMKQAT